MENETTETTQSTENIYLLSTPEKEPFFIIADSKILKLYLDLMNLSAKKKLQKKLLLEKIENEDFKKLFNEKKSKEKSVSKKEIQSVYSFIDKFMSTETKEHNEIDFWLLGGNHEENILVQEQNPCLLMYNSYFNRGFVARKNNDLNFILRNYENFIMIKKWQNINESQFDSIQNFLSTQIYSTIEELQEKTKALEEIFDIDKKSTEQIILECIENCFIITGNFKERIKSNYFFDHLENYLSIYQDQEKRNFNLKNIVNQLYSKIGIEKKRFTDGVYMCGIKQRSVSDSDLKKMEEKREKDIQKIYSEVTFDF